MKELKKILGKKKLKTGLVLIALLFTSSLFEVFSISLIIPLLDILSNTNFDLYPNYLTEVIFYFEITDYKLLVKYTFILIILVFFLRFLIFLISDFLKVNYATTIRNQLQIKLFSNYIKSDFSFFLKNRVSDLIKNLIKETLLYSDKYIFAYLNIFTDCLTLILLSLLLFFYNPTATIIIIFLIIILALVYFKVTSIKIKELSSKRQEDERQLFKLYNESFNNLKDINIYNLHDLVISKTYPVITSYNNNYKKLYKFQVAARPIFEMLLILFFLFSSFIAIFFFNTSTSHIISTFALFGAAAFRIIPSISRLLNHTQDIKFSMASKKIIENDILNFDDNIKRKKKNLLFKSGVNQFYNIKMKNINFSYGNKQIFKDLNLEIKGKKIIGIVGPSGSGKSTLLNIILGLLKSNQGEVMYFVDQKKYNVPHTNLFSYVPQDIFLLDDSVLTNIVFGKNKEIDHSKINKILEQVDLVKFINSLRDGLSTNLGDKAKKISGGQAQRISLARALYHDSEILVLDEFSNQLDNDTESKILKIIKNLRFTKTIVLVSHKSRVMNICDEVYEIKKQKLIKV